MDWTLSRMIKPALAAFGLYCAVAGYLKYIYVPQPDLPARAYLSGPFTRLGGFSYLTALPPAFADSGDSPDNPTRSQFQLYEDEKPIGPAHSVHADIASLGGGRYSHWRLDKDAAGLIFSATDNSDPNNSGKRFSYPKR
jgi:hypothetical protein